VGARVENTKVKVSRMYFMGTSYEGYAQCQTSQASDTKKIH
jgi:hypothetical protein